MAWGCFGREGEGGIALLESSVNARCYIRVCGPLIINSLNEVGVGVENGIFHQNNARPHIARSSMEWFEENGVSLLKWPGKSPGLNPIEHLWADMERRRKEYPKARSLEELWELVQEIWGSTPFSTTWNLLEFVPKRIKAVLRARGGYTTY